MNNGYGCVFLIIALISLLSCSGTETKQAETQKYFSTEKYFSEEAASLNNRETGIVKTIYKNNSSETIASELVEWRTELQPFLQIDLNKPAYINSYFTDTILNGENLLINFRAKEESMSLQNLSVYLTGTRVDSIYAVLKSENLYYRSVDTLSYSGNGNYRISAWNKPRIGKEVSFVLEGKAR